VSFFACIQSVWNLTTSYTTRFPFQPEVLSCFFNLAPLIGRIELFEMLAKLSLKAMLIALPLLAAVTQAVPSRM
jgi:hypothetical protein